MMSGHYSFTSCLAPFIESMITEKRNAGFQYEHAEWILHKFDEFCNQEQVETPVITQELAGKWGTLRKTETKVTLAGRISVLRQLSLYMQAYGIKCYVPRNFTRKSVTDLMSCHRLAHEVSNIKSTKFFSIPATCAISSRVANPVCVY